MNAARVKLLEKHLDEFRSTCKYEVVVRNMSRNLTEYSVTPLILEVSSSEDMFDSSPLKYTPSTLDGTPQRVRFSSFAKDDPEKQDQGFMTIEEDSCQVISEYPT